MIQPISNDIMLSNSIDKGILTNEAPARTTLKKREKKRKLKKAQIGEKVKKTSSGAIIREVNEN